MSTKLIPAATRCCSRSTSTTIGPGRRGSRSRGLIAGIDAERSLWKSLRAASTDDRIGEVDLHALSQRADDQRARLLPHHDAAAVEALGSAAP